MEESEKRRERLKAMRMEAAQGDVNNDVKNFTESHGLSNPLIETSATHQESSSPQRFDYYTDPMSAFSGNKRSKVSQNISQEHFTPPTDWWIAFGDEAPELRNFAVKILSLTCSSSACERNWSTFSQIHTKRRNRLSASRLNSLVYIMYNKKLKDRHIKKKALTEEEDSLVVDSVPSDNEWVAEGNDENISRVNLELDDMEEGEGTHGNERTVGGEESRQTNVRKTTLGGKRTRGTSKQGSQKRKRKTLQSKTKTKGPQNTVMTPPPALPSQINYSTELGEHQPQEPVWSPIGMPRPFDMQPGTPRGAWNGSGHTPGYYFPSNSPRGGNFVNPASPGFVQGGSPIFNSGQGRGHWFSNSPGPPGPNSVHGGIPGFGQEGGPSFNSEQGRGYWSNNSPSPGSGYGRSPGFGQEGRPNYNSGQGRGFWSNNSPSPGSGRGGSPSFGQGGRSSLNSGQGRGNWFRNSSNPDSGCGNSPGPNSGRGGGRWLSNNTSPGSGWSGGRGSGGRGRGGRGRGSHDNVSAELRPDLYYNKSMVEDPWKFLKPVIWKIEDSQPDPLKSWLPKSISMKSTKAAEASSASKSQPSLAEYLAASFNEAVKNEDINDESSV